MSSRFGPLPAAITLAAGIAVAPLLDRVGVPPGARWAVAALCLLGLRKWPMLMVAAVLAVGAARGTAPRSLPPAGAIIDDRALDRFVGTVEGPALRTIRGSAARVSGVWVWADAPLVPGDVVAVTGRVVSGRGREPFEVSAVRVERLGTDLDLASRAWRWAGETAASASARIDEAGGDPAARAALRGIVVGDRSAVPPALDDRWRAAGIYHVLSVSGLHLAVVAGLVFALLRRLIAASPWGGRIRPARWAAPPALVFAVGYTLVTGAQLATLRALIVIALVLVAAMLDRPLRLVDALGAAALIVLAWRPLDLWDPAFQLSFVAALALAVRPAPARTGRRIVRWFVHGVTTSAWIAIATAPITAYHFQQVAAGGIAGNLVLTPIVELLALPLALAGVLLGPLGAPLIRAATGLVELVDGAAGALAPITPIGHIAVASAFAMAVCVALALWLVARAGRRTRLDVVLWIALCCAWGLARTPPDPGALRVTFLDVGQGDAAIVELPDGAVWLVDAGGNASARGEAAWAPGVTITRALRAAGHDHIDLAIISHPHPDHYLGLAGLGVPVRELWIAAEPDAPAASGFPAIAARLGAPIVHPPLGLARTQAGVTLEVLAPRYAARDGAPPIEAADPVRSVNDNSLVIAIGYRGRRVLFAGDVEREGEDALIASGLATADVVKVPHHGSPTSSSEPFVRATRPTLAVISCGRGNAFGFPSSAVVARWHAVGADVARTDRGSVRVVVDAAGGLAVE